MKINVVSAIFIIFSLCLFNNAYGKATNSKDSSKNVIKKSAEPIIDVQELISDMVKKEEDIVQLTKNKKSLKRINMALATALSVVSALLIGGTGLVMYNSDKGRRPFQLGGSKDPSPEDDTSSGSDSIASLASNANIEAAGKEIRDALKKLPANVNAVPPTYV
ncbi:circumsporozoite-related antigen exported protein 1, putative [Plasmodium vinckei brucechwatti]|uniref:Circumsporozoite-related antigen exported protein 1, putative n=1 Tax=Plasmodium vinckei brucechwatti TaxID=119398 RepID=A0A6V7S3Z3_PLAVN|nr:circumsporozoite-related antigen exported protein 1, putative [Plasmodium vinckei brucechwatti]